jgi:Icc-related predicted phosphoesterase
MKILAFTDTHANNKNISNLKKSYLKYNPDILICAGDFTNMGSNISKNLKALHFGKKLLFIPGNHEEHNDLNIKHKNIISIHNSSIIFKDILFLGCGGGFSGNIEENLQKSQKQLEQLIKNFRKSNKKSKIVMVTHRPPHKTTCDYMEEIEEHVGAKNIRKFLIKNKIDLSLCGHIHECFGNSDQIGKMLVINPGPNGAIVEI